MPIFTKNDKGLGLSPHSRVSAKNVFLVFAASRSGHHAIIYFICNQFNGVIRRLNYCDWMTHDRLGMWSTDTQFKRGEKIRCLTSNYENFDISKYKAAYSNSRVARFVIGNPKVHNIVVLRDPYNFIASKEKTLKYMPDAQFGKKKYLIYARHMLGIDVKIPKCINVNYNKWCDDIAYRKWLSSAVGGDRFVDFIDHVPKSGCGSSFDWRKMDGKGSEMKTRERWKQMPVETIRKHSGFLFDNSVIDLSRKIFGRDFIDEMVDGLKHKLGKNK